MTEPPPLILLTGATGLLGRELVPLLLGKGCRIRALYRSGKRRSRVPGHEQVDWAEGSLNDVLFLEKALEGVGAVVHAAALVSFYPGDRKALHETNAGGTASLVNACLHQGSIRKFVHVSSVATISPSKPEPAEADERQGFNPDGRTSDYAWSKYMAELEVFRAIEEGLNAAIVNPSIILGRAGADESSGRLPAYVTRNRLFYPGGWLNYVDARDVAAAIGALLEPGLGSGQRLVLNAGTIPYRSFFEHAAALTGKKAPFVLCPAWLARAGGFLSEAAAALTGDRPALTRFTAASSGRKVRYQSANLENLLPGFRFFSLGDSLSYIFDKNRS